MGETDVGSSNRRAAHICVYCWIQPYFHTSRLGSHALVHRAAPHLRCSSWLLPEARHRTDGECATAGAASGSGKSFLLGSKCPCPPNLVLLHFLATALLLAVNPGVYGESAADVQLNATKACPWLLAISLTAICWARLFRWPPFSHLGPAARVAPACHHCCLSARAVVGSALLHLYYDTCCAV